MRHQIGKAAVDRTKAAAAKAAARAKAAAVKADKIKIEPNLDVVQSSKKRDTVSAKPSGNKLNESNSNGSFIDTANDLLNE